MRERQPPDDRVEEYHVWTQDDRRAPHGAVVAYVIIVAAIVCIAAAVTFSGLL